MGAVDPAEHLGLVWQVAKTYAKHSGESVEDLAQEGSIGLMRAAEKFDPTRGFKFTTYASWWIASAIRNYLVCDCDFVHVPYKVRKTEGIAPRPVSLDQVRGRDDDGEPFNMYRLIEDASAENPADEAARREEAAIIAKAVMRLPDPHSYVVNMRFGEGWTLDDVGAELGISRERVRQIEKEAIDMLREYLPRRLS